VAKLIVLDDASQEGSGARAAKLTTSSGSNENDRLRAPAPQPCFLLYYYDSTNRQ